MPDPERRLPIPPPEASQEPRYVPPEMMGSYYYPIQDKDLAVEIVKANNETLPEVISNAISYSEGLILGREVDLTDDNEVLFYMGLFLTGEGALKVPLFSYANQALEIRTSGRVREIRSEARTTRRPLTEEEKKEKTLLIGMENWNNARQTAHQAFLERVITCASEEAAADLALNTPAQKAPTTPDKTVWQNLFGQPTKEGEATPQSEFGNYVDLTMRGLVAIGIPPRGTPEFDRLHPDFKNFNFREVLPPADRNILPCTIYTTGFDSESFKALLNYALHISDGRMDVVWEAWKLFETWEMTTNFGYMKDFGQKKDTPKYIHGDHKLGGAPIMSALYAWIDHLPEKRAFEYGYWADGTLNPESPHKLSHSGHPLSISKIPSLCGDFLKETKVDAPGGGKKSLREIWAGGMSFADREFPWTHLEQATQDMSRLEEQDFGSYSSWLFRRRRAFNMVKDIRELPFKGLNDYGKADFFSSRIRNWRNTLYLPKADQYTPDQNPMVWLMADIIFNHHPETNNHIPWAQKNPDLALRTSLDPKERFSFNPINDPDAKKLSAWEFLRAGYDSTWITKKDAEWIRDYLKIPTAVGQRGL
ncbi:hypothetical protein COT44_03435 [Candidatus Shapirobacteria bacterium CG08_land_8_20_14_0_20_39_18]|uniref:Uncharacterized protein n=1 Tax=Candidatus Shapirobacteria bacterium CG08_land_8_20_14_0_20_39_18 TaxID=1974883 RepID=A0A2M6XCR8_9BACT|nr:MAG: hypothetical protein COT44_03435 [Candidatus Shapirobacteria bacterium CG08_land_8_20_14_0_20_39_18]PIY65113.1 MAG: hypothetical protein COY91_03545 [Candidatus Shapirobacteria bacterium CG_4_10_14_0_8_um_filter_39_15]PJE68297.1 MAG: hypothetical protein COU94_02610 [Candidatus Shapirobacteria bacterium CG10_big_fil_rev_8_21_14_0_10_38_8]